jgi:hypothetical protein
LDTPVSNFGKVPIHYREGPYPRVPTLQRISDATHPSEAANLPFAVPAKPRIPASQPLVHPRDPISFGLHPNSLRGASNFGLGYIQSRLGVHPLMDRLHPTMDRSDPPTRTMHPPADEWKPREDAPGPANGSAASAHAWCLHSSLAPFSRVPTDRIVCPPLCLPVAPFSVESAAEGGEQTVGPAFTPGSSGSVSLQPAKRAAGWRS